MARCRNIWKMRQSASVRQVALTIIGASIVIMATALLAEPRGLMTALRSTPQKRRLIRQRRVPKPAASQQATSKYSNFTHQSHGKDSNDPRARLLKCNNCHLIASAAEPDRIGAVTSTKRNIVLGYPYHDACLRCHEHDKDFYRGDRPAICSVCHSRVAVRLTSRDVFPQFPSTKHSNLTSSELPAYFPHGLHQSLLALDRRQRRDMDAPSFARISFNFPDVENKWSSALDCDACHFTDSRGVIALPLAGLRSEDSFTTIARNTFETIPGFDDAGAHRHCFNCHWEAGKPGNETDKPFQPTGDNCVGCHISRSDYAARKIEILASSALSPSSTKWFERWPIGLPKRLALKFRHNTHTLLADGKTEENKHEAKCTDCHINITRMASAEPANADVQIVACAQCHGTTSVISIGGGDKVSIFDELTRKDDPSKNYRCIACHTVVIGSERPPCDHYWAAGQPCAQSSQVK